MKKTVLLVLLPDGKPDYRHFSWADHEDTIVLKIPKGKLSRVEIDTEALTYRDLDGAD